jgi:hypothetical protein
VTESRQARSDQRSWWKRLVSWSFWLSEVANIEDDASCYRTRGIRTEQGPRVKDAKKPRLSHRPRLALNREKAHLTALRWYLSVTVTSVVWFCSQMSAMSSEPLSQPMLQSAPANSVSDDISAQVQSSVSEPIQLPGYFEDVQLDDLAVLIGALCLFTSRVSVLTTPFLETYIGSTSILISGLAAANGRPQ